MFVRPKHLAFKNYDPKSFETLISGANVIKTFTTVIYALACTIKNYRFAISENGQIL
jgi:hypothetical protein